MKDPISRRDFMTTSAGAAILAAPAVLPAMGANNKVRVGWIGVGSRGSYPVDRMNAGSHDMVEVTAVCDTLTRPLRAGEDKIQTLWPTSPKTYEAVQESCQAQR